MIINKTNHIKNYNFFIALLRMYLAFIVLNNHCLIPSKYIIKKKYIRNFLLNKIPVPIFFIMSFYFCHNLLTSKNLEKIKSRFERMLIPYFLWPIIIWIINNLLYLTLGMKLPKSFSALKIQLMTGHFYVTVLWFQYNLIFITLFILIIELLISKNKLLIFINLEIIAYFFQYSDLNFEIFSKYNFYKRYTFGRFLEVLPFCLTGYIFAYLKILDSLKKIRIKSLYILSLIIIIIIKYDIFIYIRGFRYEGIELHIKAFIIFCIVLLMPSEKIKNKYIIQIIKIIANNTPGIYYLHFSIGKYTENLIPSVKKKNLNGCIIIYIICYIICFFGIKLFRKTKLKNLFQ